MLGSPFFNKFDDDYQYVRPGPSSYNYNRYEQEQRRRAALRAKEEARRRAGIERYYRMKELEEKERFRRQQEQDYEERLRRMAILEERRRREQELVEEEAYRMNLLRDRQAVELAERQDRVRALRFLSCNNQNDDADNDDSNSEYRTTARYAREPVYQLVRGSDGRVYRVQVGTKQVPIQSKSSRSEDVGPLDKEDGPTDRSFHGSLNDIRDAKNVEEKDSSPAKEVTKSASFTTILSENEESKAIPVMVSKKGRTGTKKTTRIQVIVEDASDSETEDEFYNSPWRNRRPSPGAWIEPVEFFDANRRQ